MSNLIFLHCLSYSNFFLPDVTGTTTTVAAVDAGGTVTGIDVVVSGVVGPEVDVIGPEVDVVGPEVDVVGPEVDVVGPEVDVVGPEVAVVGLLVTSFVVNAQGGSSTVKYKDKNSNRRSPYPHSR